VTSLCLVLKVHYMIIVVRSFSVKFQWVFQPCGVTEYSYLVQYRECCLLPSCKSNAKPACGRMSMSHSLHYARWVRYWRQTARNLHELCAGYTLRVYQGDHIWAKSGWDWLQIDQMLYFSDQIYVHFGSPRSEKVLVFSHLGPNLTSLACTILSILASLDYIAYQRHMHASLLPLLHTSLAYTSYNFTYRITSPI